MTAGAAGLRRKALLCSALCAGLFFLFLAAALVTPGHGFTGRYYAGTSWAGLPVATGIDTRIRLTHEMLEKKAGRSPLFSVLWEGHVFLNKETIFELSISSDDGSWVFVDGKLEIDNGGVRPEKRARKEIALARGAHTLIVKFFNASGEAKIDFSLKRKRGRPFFLRGPFVYPEPVSSGTVLFDTVLFYLKLILGAALLLIGINAARRVPVLVSPMYQRYVLIEQKILAIVAPRLSGMRRRLKPIAVMFIVSSLLLLAGRWSSPVHGLTGKYYHDPGGAPFKTTLDTVLHFDEAALLERVEDDKDFRIVWEGFIFAPKNSTYRFAVSSAGGSKVFIDGRPIFDNGDMRSPPVAETDLRLSGGSHALRIEYVHAGGDAFFDFRWREMDTAKAFMPKLHFYPKPAGWGTVILDAVLSYLKKIAGLVAAVAGFPLFVLGAGILRPRWRLTSVLAVAVFFAVAGISATTIIGKRSTAVYGCDSYAYLQGAELMARNGFFRTEYTDPLVPEISAGLSPSADESKEIFFLSPHGYYVQTLDKGLVYNVFPPGMSMILYPLVKIGGRPAAFYLLPVLNVILVLLLFYLGAKSTNILFGICLSAVTMFNVHVFNNTVLIMSDVPSLALIGLSAYGLYRSIGTRRFFWPALAGASFGLSIAVRYSNLAGALPLAYLFWLNVRERRSWKSFLGIGAGFGTAAALFGFLPLAIYTNRLFGTVSRMVYEPTTQSRMALENFTDGASFFLRSLLQTFGIPVLALIAAGLVATMVKPQLRAAGIVCILGFLGFFGFYSLQSILNDRYLLPAYLFLGLLFAFGAAEIFRSLRRSALLTLAFAAFVAIYPFAHSKARYVPGNRTADGISTALLKRTGPKSVVFCDQLSGPVRFYAGLPGYRFTWTNAETLIKTIGILRTSGYEVYFLLDSDESKIGFQMLLENDPAIRDAARAESPLKGIPLYRLAAANPAVAAAGGMKERR